MIKRQSNHFTRHNVQLFEPDRIRKEVYKTLYGNPINPEPEGQEQPTKTEQKEMLKTTLSGFSTKNKKQSKFQRH